MAETVGSASGADSATGGRGTIGQAVMVATTASGWMQTATIVYLEALGVGMGVGAISTVRVWWVPAAMPGGSCYVPTRHSEPSA